MFVKLTKVNEPILEASLKLLAISTLDDEKPLRIVIARSSRGNDISGLRGE